MEATNKSTSQTTDAPEFIDWHLPGSESVATIVKGSRAVPIRIGDTVKSYLSNSDGMVIAMTRDACVFINNKGEEETAYWNQLCATHIGRDDETPEAVAPTTTGHAAHLAIRPGMAVQGYDGDRDVKGSVVRVVPEGIVIRRDPSEQATGSPDVFLAAWADGITFDDAPELATHAAEPLRPGEYVKYDYPGGISDVKVIEVNPGYAVIELDTYDEANPYANPGDHVRATYDKLLIEASLVMDGVENVANWQQPTTATGCPATDNPFLKLRRMLYDFKVLKDATQGKGGAANGDKVAWNELDDMNEATADMMGTLAELADRYDKAHAAAPASNAGHTHVTNPIDTRLYQIIDEMHAFAAEVRVLVPDDENGRQHADHIDEVATDLSNVPDNRINGEAHERGTERAEKLLASLTK